ILQKSFVNFYNKLYNPKERSTKVPFKYETLSTPILAIRVMLKENALSGLE
ncbi:19630_t:CDS:1, partial [Gigaspora margarita]